MGRPTSPSTCLLAPARRAPLLAKGSEERVARRAGWRRRRRAVNPLSIKEQHVARLQAAGARHGAGRRRRSPGVLQKLDSFVVAVAPEAEPVLVDLHKLRGRSLGRQRNNIGWWVAGSRSGSMTTIRSRDAVARMSSPMRGGCGCDAP